MTLGGRRLPIIGLLLTFAFALLEPSVHAQSVTAALRGSWAASVSGGQTLRGTWTAEPVSANADVAQGTWTLVNDANRTTMAGTWAAGRSAGRWSGTWQARIVTRENPQGQVLSGTWRTEAPALDVKTFFDLLTLSAHQQVSGAWASGRFSGAWSLRAN